MNDIYHLNYHFYKSFTIICFSSVCLHWSSNINLTKASGFILKCRLWRVVCSSAQPVFIPFPLEFSHFETQSCLSAASIRFLDLCKRTQTSMPFPMLLCCCCQEYLEQTKSDYSLVDQQGSLVSGDVQSYWSTKSLLLGDEPIPCSEGLTATVSTGKVQIGYQTVGPIHSLEQCFNRYCNKQWSSSTHWKSHWVL